MCQLFFVVGDRALYNGKQHNCQDPKPIINTLVTGRGRSRSSMHNSGIVQQHNDALPTP